MQAPIQDVQLIFLENFLTLWIRALSCSKASPNFSNFMSNSFNVSIQCQLLIVIRHLMSVSLPQELIEYQSMRDRRSFEVFWPFWDQIWGFAVQKRAKFNHWLYRSVLRRYQELYSRFGRAFLTFFRRQIGRIWRRLHSAIFVRERTFCRQCYFFRHFWSLVSLTKLFVENELCHTLIFSIEVFGSFKMPLTNFLWLRSVSAVFQKNIWLKILYSG